VNAGKGMGNDVPVSQERRASAKTEEGTPTGTVGKNRATILPLELRVQSSKKPKNNLVEPKMKRRRVESPTKMGIEKLHEGHSRSWVEQLIVSGNPYQATHQRRGDKWWRKETALESGPHLNSNNKNQTG